MPSENTSDDNGDVPWSESAPQYKKDGELYANVEFDHNGDPHRVRVAQNQTRRGEFNIEGSTAIYDPHNIPTLPQADDEVREVVGSLPFVDDVDMGGA